MRTRGEREFLFSILCDFIVTGLLLRTLLADAARQKFSLEFIRRIDFCFLILFFDIFDRRIRGISLGFLSGSANYVLGIVPVWAVLSIDSLVCVLIEWKKKMLSVLLERRIHWCVSRLVQWRLSSKLNRKLENLIWVTGFEMRWNSRTCQTSDWWLKNLLLCIRSKMICFIRRKSRATSQKNHIVRHLWLLIKTRDIEDADYSKENCSLHCLKKKH